MMTRKDYILIAAALKQSKPDKAVTKMTGKEFRARLNTWHDACMEIADSLEGDNLNFDKGKFFQACGFRAIF